MAWEQVNPWRCWERTTLPAVVNGPEDLLVRVALSDPRRSVFQTEFRWPALARLGPNAFYGQYAQITLRFLDVRWSFEAAAVGERTYLRVRCLNPAAADGMQIHLETMAQTAGARIVSREHEVLAQRARTWRITPLSPSTHRSGTTLLGPLARPFYALIEPVSEIGRLEQRDVHPRSVAPADAPLANEEREAAALLAQARDAELGRLRYVPDALRWFYDAVPRGLGWNVIWASDRREPVVVCSRDWCVHGNYGEWVLFNWDQFLLVPMAARFDPELAHVVAGPQLAVQTPEGLVPGIASALGISGDRGMPPDASLGLLKAYRLTEDRSFVERYYDQLCAYHHWWRRNRDGNGDGLLEWGSNPVPPPHPQWQAHTYWASRYETGMDNHPMWDGVRFNAATNTQEQTDVGLSALHALDALCLSYMAEVLGRSRDAAGYRAYSEKIGRLIHEHLWNDALGLWLSRDWDGTWNLRASPCCFYPLFLPTTPAACRRRAIDEHLRNPRRFGGRYVMPVTPRDDAAYPEQYYVRGRVWPGQTYLVHAALRECGEEVAAAELARGCIETFRQEWLEQGYLRENYNAETGRSDDTPESDLIYSYGMMMPQIAWNQLEDVRLDGTPVRGELAQLAGCLDEHGALRARIDPLSE